MLIVLATTSNPTRKNNAKEGSRSAIFRASPLLVSHPMQALISWIAVMQGSVRKMVQVNAKPNCAPAWEYVAMPLGSSSAAPVVRPGPRALKRRLKCRRVRRFRLMATISSPQKPQGESKSPKHRKRLPQRSKELAGTVIDLKRKGRDGRAKRDR